MVSFNDYPVGPLGPDKSEGGTNTSGTSTGGNVSPTGGSQSGGSVTVMGGTSAGNNTSGSGGASGGTAATGGTGATAGSGGTDTGGTASGGTVAMGGTDAMPGGSPSDGGAPAVETGMIDDFEDGDGSILNVSGRSGSWYTSNDGTNMQTPKPGTSLVPTELKPPRDMSTRAARTTGGTFNTWGALLGTALSGTINAASPYDVSKYQGVRFWAKNVSNAWNAAKKLRVSIPMTGTVPGTGCTVCNDHFSADVDLFGNWTLVSVPFTAFKQGGTGKPQLAKPDLNHVIFLEFGVAAHLSFDFYIDDVELY